jgi:CheW-like domain
VFDRNAPSTKGAIAEIHDKEVYDKLRKHAPWRTGSKADAKDLLADAIECVGDPDRRPEGYRALGRRAERSPLLWRRAPIDLHSLRTWGLRSIVDLRHETRCGGRCLHTGGVPGETDVTGPGANHRVEILVFEISGLRFALLASDVRELTRAVAIVPLPRAPRIVEGIINVRGSLVPVLDIRRRFHLAQRAASHMDHLILAWAGSDWLRFGQTALWTSFASAVRRWKK